MYSRSHYYKESIFQLFKTVYFGHLSPTLRDVFYFPESVVTLRQNKFLLLKWKQSVVQLSGKLGGFPWEILL